MLAELLLEGAPTVALTAVGAVVLFTLLIAALEAAEFVSKRRKP